MRDQQTFVYSESGINQRGCLSIRERITFPHIDRVRISRTYRDKKFYKVQECKKKKKKKAFMIAWSHLWDS